MPLLSGTVNEEVSGVNVEVYSAQDRVFAGQAVVDGKTWSIGVTSDLDSGSYEIIATATDLAGNSMIDNSTEELFISTNGGIGVPTEYNDEIIGTDAGDTITGIPDGSINAGVGSIDTLTGLGGQDIFVLGDTIDYYDDKRPWVRYGGLDYALISDFEDGVDKLQLAGDYDQYVFANFSIDSISGAGIFRNNGFSKSLDPWDELIGFLEGISARSITAADLA